MPLAETRDPEVPSRVFILKSLEKMKKKDWQKEGKPNWWVRVGTGEIIKFFEIPEVPGYEPLEIELNLDKQYFAYGEVLYFGVGSEEKGIRDEYYPKYEESTLEWWKKPLKEKTPFSKWHVWWTKDFRYRIVRSVPNDMSSPEAYYPESFCFAACFGKSMLLCREASMEKCLAIIEKDARKRFSLVDLHMNGIDLLIEAGLAGLDFLPDDERPKPLPPTRAEPKQEKAIKQQKPGVTKAIIELLEGATKDTPLRKPDLLEELMNRFPDKDVSALISTVSARLADLCSRHGKNVQGDKEKGYWIDGIPNTVSPEVKKETVEDSKPARSDASGSSGGGESEGQLSSQAGGDKGNKQAATKTGKGKQSASKKDSQAARAKRPTKGKPKKAPRKVVRTKKKK